MSDSAIVGSQTDHELLKPKAPYVPRNRTVRQAKMNIVEGVTPLSLQAFPYVMALPHVDIPAPPASALEVGSLAELIDHFHQGFLPPVLDNETYSRHFKHLLWIEEFRMSCDLEMYDISNARMTAYLPNYYLEIP